MKFIVADTNALISPFKNKFNIDTELQRLFGSYTIVVPRPLIGELEKLSISNTHARAALKYARTRDIRPTESCGDDAVIELAERIGGMVMTNDKELIEIARKRGLGVVRLKEGRRLVMEHDWMDQSLR